MYGDIIRRKVERPAYCRGCDRQLPKGTEVVSTYSIRNRGMQIFLCAKCAKLIGELGKEIDND